MRSGSNVHLLCNYDNQNLENSFCKTKFCTTSTGIPRSSPQLLASTYSESDHTRYSCGIYGICPFWWLAHFTWCNVLEAHPCGSMCQNSRNAEKRSVYSRALCLSMPRSHQQIFGRLHLSAWPEETLLSVLLGIYPGVELLRHMVMLLLILGNIELFSVELHHLEFC